jgi:pimeloyl-ACP methyl ester carboxylesterase
MEGRARYYKRAGVGVPIVLLHSINAAASSFEMKPIFDHLKATTTRPIYALDWLGFGLSERPPARYSPGLYQRQLRRLLSEYVGETADVVALSLACEYAATVANAFPVLVNRLVFISPTGVGHPDHESIVQKVAVGLASSIGAFEVFFSRLSQRESLQRFYAEHVFRQPERIPAPLVDYARRTMQISGAHHAPRRFIQGQLSMHEYAPKAYEHLAVPTLFIIPETLSDAVQDFVRAPDIASANANYIRLGNLASGLLPQWEDPDQLFPLIDEFLKVKVEMPSQPVS